MPKVQATGAPMAAQGMRLCHGLEFWVLSLKLRAYDCHGIPLNCGSRHVATPGGLAGSTGRDLYALIWQLFMGSSCTE